MGPNATISWAKVNNKPDDLAYVDDIPILPEYIQSTYIDFRTVASPRIYGGEIIGGRITSNSEINVETNANIGRRLYMDAQNFNDGIYFNTMGRTSITVDNPYSGLLITGSLVVDGEFAVLDGKDGSFTSEEGYTIRVRGGLITSIS